MTKQTPIKSSLQDVQAIKNRLWAAAEAVDRNFDDPKIRSEILRVLKDIRHEGLQEAQAGLLEHGSGRICAQAISHQFDALIAALFSFSAEAVFRSENRSTAELMSVVAVGGYGRGMLAPGSDIDLMFLLPYKQTPWGESVVEYILYLLWDMGLKVGHSTRRVDEAIRLSKQDMTIRTSILEARHLCGDRDLFEDLVARYHKEIIVRGTAADFIQAKLAERDERHLRNGQSRYLVEPNVKEGKGGLRDLHTLFWIAKYYFQVQRTEDVVKVGLLSRAEYNRFIKCNDFLWAVRCHLHFLNPRPDERITFDVQRPLAERLGYTSHPGMRDVERFMKHYFLIAKDVGDLTRIVCSVLEERQLKEAPGLNRYLRVFRRTRRMKTDHEDFLVENDRITVASDDVFSRDPVNLIRIFHIADRLNIAFHPDAVRLIARSLKHIDARLRENPQANRLFLEILSSPNDPESVLRRMNETGVLGRFMRDFGKIVAMMQFNMYHHYTVDEHLIRAIGVLSEIERGQLAEDHPLANEIIKTVDDRSVLFVSLFLHDIAKGRPEDHSVAGARVARRFCKRLGFSANQIETVAWLVDKHLIMSEIAQSRDLSDRKTISDFAKQVETLERLKLILILTVADIKAVGPGVWNGWKGQLLRTLYYATEPLLTGGHSEIGRDGVINMHKEELDHALGEWPQDARRAYIDVHRPAYWLRTDLETQLRHAGLYKQHHETNLPMTMSSRVLEFEEITEITIISPDKKRLLAVMAGACMATGADIVDAQIYTTTDDHVINSIYVARAFERDLEEHDRCKRIGDLIGQVLCGDRTLASLEEARTRDRRNYRSKAFVVETDVRINNQLSDSYTVAEVHCIDRPGLLFDLTETLSGLGLIIVSAQIATFGEKVVDTFYLLNDARSKISGEDAIAIIKKELRRAADGRSAKAARKKVTSAA